MLTLIPLVLGWVWADSFSKMLLVGLLLGVAGASFAVALPLASRWYPPEHQGLAMGIAGAGNSGFNGARHVLRVRASPNRSVGTECSRWQADSRDRDAGDDILLLGERQPAKQPPPQPLSKVRRRIGACNATHGGSVSFTESPSADSSVSPAC